LLTVYNFKDNDLNQQPKTPFQKLTMSETAELTKPERRPPALGSRGIELSDFNQLWNFAGIVKTSGMHPRGMDTQEKIFLALQTGLEIGLTPMSALQNAMVVNNRVSFWGELVVGLVQSHPEFVDMTTEYKGEGKSRECFVTITRKGRSPEVGHFSIAKAEHLISDPNKKDTWGHPGYQDDMLFWRAFGRAKRAFSDRLKGVKLPHEIEEEENGEGLENARNVTPITVKPAETNKTSKHVPETSKPRESGTPQGVESQGVTYSAKEPELSTLAQQIRGRLIEHGIAEDKFLRMLVQSRLIEPAIAAKGLGLVSEKALKIALGDWDMVLNNCGAVTDDQRAI
jgi:hypothetical protein